MIFFALREGWRNFRNLGILGLLTLVSLAITLIVIGISARGYFLVEEWTEDLLGKFEIEAFLDPRIDSSAVSHLQADIYNLSEVQSVRFISKATAAERFERQFGGELLNLLAYNPLPPSFVVTMAPSLDPTETWSLTANVIKTMKGVEDVVYQGELLNQVQDFYRSAAKTLFIIVSLTLILSFGFTIMTVYSAIRSREDFIHIVLICGGSRAMARGPFVAMGMYYGIAGGLFASASLFGIGEILLLGWGIVADIPLYYPAGLVTIGAIVGMMGAGWAAGRRIRGM